MTTTKKQGMYVSNFKKLAFAVAGAMAVLGGAANAAPLPSGWTCTSECGSSGSNGVVTTPPNGGNYMWVSTAGSNSNTGLGLGNEENGSVARSMVFTGAVGEELRFHFNFVTSDGAGYADYGWARLLNADDNSVAALLFTARTTPGGNTVPGFEMPEIDAVIEPGTVAVIAGGPDWAPLGSSSGNCFNINGCGYTGWVTATYELEAEGRYMLEFGVVNWDDDNFDSGLAFAGTTIAGEPIGGGGTVPVPGVAGLLGLGLAGLAIRRRRRA